MIAKLAVILLLAISLFSCEKEGFSVDKAKLIHEAVYSDGEKIEEKVKFSSILSSDGKYELTLTDPSNSISFTSSLTKEGEYYRSEELKITAYSTFLKGEYSYTIIKDDGTEFSGVVSLDYDETYPLSYNDDVDYLEAYLDGALIAETDGSSYPPYSDKLILYKEDSRNNRISSIISLSSSDHLP